MDALETEKITKDLTVKSPVKSISIIVGASIVLGIITGAVVSSSGKGQNYPLAGLSSETPKSAQDDTQTFKDFATGILEVKPAPKNPSEYSEGTHMLKREKELPVALTSSVVDLSKYEGKKVKVFGETQKALVEGWLMDVGKIEEL